MKKRLIAEGKLDKHGKPKKELLLELPRNVIPPGGVDSMVVGIAASTEPITVEAPVIEEEKNKRKKYKCGGKKRKLKEIGGSIALFLLCKSRQARDEAVGKEKKRNYRFFYMFIASSTFLCIYVFTFSWINILEQKHKGSVWKAMHKEVLSVVLIVYCFIAVWFVGGLTVFHFYLICTNQTTYENFRYRYDKKENPYNKGMLHNIRELFFSKIPPSMNNFRDWVLEEDHIQVSITPKKGHSVVNPKEKIDVEIGSKFIEDGGIPVPDILQNLDYSGIDDNSKSKDSSGGIMYDPFFFPANQGAFSSGGSSTAEDRSHDGDSSHKTTTPILRS
ncbi:hypothetical protein GIB67_024733 [Kingdonia uniflora]|uniref:S-acyltransferase n=1 Tax=Kingdonia uniflora TaxID=39325 RepID=A0A7J7NAJ0_9MAGN|nr:hypothetical protein GIB67_024733 [Kingdonia uniflora]